MGGPGTTGTIGAAALLTLMLGAQARAQDLEYLSGDLRIGVTGTLVSGALWRMEDRDTALLGKLNVPGQQNLCTADDCMSLSGDPTPNLRLVHAAGSFSGGNTDNGDLNYGRHDIVSAPTRLTPTFSFSDGDWSGKLRGVLFYDPVNDRFDETHTNTRFQPASTPRPHNISRQFARGGQLQEAYVARSVEWGGSEYLISLGNQTITWGESVLTAFNTLNTIGPPDAVLARMPGFQLHELYQPVPALSVAADIGNGLTAAAFYQWYWTAANPDPTGSFFSTSDFIGGGKYLTLGLGQYAEDPNGEFRAAGFTSLLSQSTRNAAILPDAYGRPRNGGQYGIQLKYLAEKLRGTEFGLYYANYHSRLPYISAISASASCTRAAVDNSFAAALVACRGFNSAFNPIGLNPAPVDTMKIFLDYPENIHMVGLSFNTNFGPWSLAGEYALRPNMPLQVNITDVIFAGLAPAFPSADIAVPANTNPIGVNPPFTIPGHRHIVPDYLSGYRGLAEYGPNQIVHGYQRYTVGQFSLVGIHVFGPSENPFGADQIQLLAEVSGTQVFGLPPLSQLQLEGTGDRTHFSPGADGTGLPGGKPDSLRINPTQQKTGAATSFSWGYRLALRGQYSHAIGDISLSPALILFHDLGGISPATIDNYVAGRKTINLQLDAQLAQNLVAGTQYQWFTGAGGNNRRSDRDNLGVYVRYSF
ncbi:MAG: DUF1302 domain-containing protein [Stenotrophobium sp.]